MYRLFEEELSLWQKNGMNKPMMIIGARQIGKTYTIDKFCKNNFDNYLYFNLEKMNDIRSIFEKTIVPEDIIREIEIRIEKTIDVTNTILFFDEVQVSEEFITSLKYFCESELPYKIICAGSLLGVKLNRFNSSFPVGKVDMLNMYPMNFKEFLIALGQDKLITKIEECFKDMRALDNDLHEKALTLYKHYLIVGGMPEAVSNYIEHDGNIVAFDRKIINIIIETYLSDMNKYTINKSESVKIEKVFKTIPKELAHENKRFKYSLIEDGASKRKFQTAIDWLNASSIIISCYNAKKQEIPLKAYIEEDVFKIYYSDVGILNSMCDIGINDIMNDTPFMFKGAIAENYVASLLRFYDIPLIYWKSNNESEIDFILTTDDGIIPVEVKATNRITSKSLGIYMEKFKPRYAIRISMKNFGYENNIKSIPLYAAFCLEKLKQK